MGTTILTDKFIKSRKNYRCDAFDYVIHANWSEKDLKEMLSIDDYILYLKAKDKNFMIEKGEKYRYYTSPQNGTIYTFRESFIGNHLAITYDLYDEC